MAAAIAYAVFARGMLPAWLLSIPVVAFVALAAFHSRVIRRQTLAGRALRYYDRAMARVEDRWKGDGPTGERFRDSEHIYSEDLDLFGEGSLFQMLAQMRTAAGEETLARWLLAPADPDETLARQDAVRELRDRLDLRETLALLGPDVQSEANISALEHWAAAPAVYFPAALRPMAAILGAVGLGCVIAFFAQAIPFWAMLALAAVDILIAVAFRMRVRQVLSSAEAAAHGLGVLALVLEQFERETFTSAKLVALRRRLDIDGASASLRIHRLGRWMDWLDSLDHVLVRTLAPIVFFREQVAIGLERWRRDSGPSMGAWIQTIGELEALCSLAALHYERPDWTFPELREEHGYFVASGLEHPLLAQDKSVANDLALTPPLQLLIVSGSNMSGKSTLLRAVGLNSALAWAGGPTAARQLSLSRLFPGASIRITDSLQDSRSRFFAEITRLRQIVGLSASIPVLFLLDELLSGTNSFDRRIGAEAIMVELVRTGAIGLMTTHDLALVEIAAALEGNARNVHLEDRMGGGGMDFDYKLKDGIVTHSNALALMRAVGLNV